MTERVKPADPKEIERQRQYEARYRENLDELDSAQTPERLAELAAQNLFIKHILGRDVRTETELETGINKLFDHLERNNKVGADYLSAVVGYSDQVTKSGKRDPIRRIHQIKKEVSLLFPITVE